MKRAHDYLPATREALSAMGHQIAAARTRLGWTEAELATRVGVGPQTIRRLEDGAPGTQIGTVFEAAVLLGIPLFNVPASQLSRVAASVRDQLALLPARVDASRPEFDDDF
jgi:transcriptional regulator with XRE-family HTH domain